MKRLLSNKRGVSSVLGVLLLVLVTVTSGVFFYNYVSGLVDSMKTNLNTQLSLLLIEAVNINTTCITAYLRNTGRAVANIVTAYVNSIPAVLSRLVELAPSTVAPIYIYGNYLIGSTYQVKLTSTLGMLATFDARL